MVISFRRETTRAAGKLEAGMLESRKDRRRTKMQNDGGRMMQESTMSLIVAQPDRHSPVQVRTFPDSRVHCMYVGITAPTKENAPG
jgi:hypothetical protein